ncbi:MAG: TetR/AcrR family transcriptional regulator [Oscillospiraceae bacterium]|nr:TetR/AcrR family transcriptional regulator [Oscillospiraceae bacterium]
MKKIEKLDITKEKLITAAGRLIDSCDESAVVTSRAIANEAGVQLAMINYCFGSREALLFETFCRRENEYKNDPLLLEIFRAEIPPKEKLRRLHYVIAEFLIKNYKYSKAITGYVLLHRDLSKELNSLPLVTAHYNGRKTQQECRIISYELSSVMQLAVYRHKELENFSGFDLTDTAQLHKFVDLQIDLFLKD